MIYASTRPETAGLMHLYQSRIEPSLEVLEESRLLAIYKAFVCVALGLFVSVAVWFLKDMQFLQGVKITRGLPFVWALATPIVLGSLAAKLMLDAVAVDTKTAMVKASFEHMGWTYSERARVPFGYGKLVDYRLLPKHSTGHFEDSVRGKVGNVGFFIVEAKIVSQYLQTSSPVFQGFVMAIDFHQPFESTTIVLREKGLFNTKKLERKGLSPVEYRFSSRRMRRKLTDSSIARPLKRVGMASPKWEAMFEAYSDDQVEARVKLDPDFMERLMALEESVDGKNLRFGFFDNRLHIVCETGDRFEPRAMSVKLTDPLRMVKLIGEIEAIIGLVEAVQKPGRQLIERV